METLPVEVGKPPEDLVRLNALLADRRLFGPLERGVGHRGPPFTVSQSLGCGGS